jgi:hypothetical protein
MSEEVLSKQENEKKTKIQEVITDGGYDSIANRKAMSQIGKPKWSLAKLKGRQIVYQMKYNEKGELIIVDVKRSELYQVAYIEKKGKYRIKTNIGTYHYWTKTEIQDDIDTQAILGNHTEENYNLRANVESIIHQTFHRLCKRQKSTMPRHDQEPLVCIVASNVGECDKNRKKLIRDVGKCDSMYLFSPHVLYKT